MRLDVIEGSPSNAPEFKVVLINLRAMAIYADLVGAQQLRIMKPISMRRSGNIMRATDSPTSPRATTSS